MANNDHYAILVTISKYPGLSNLNGPEADGVAFTQWLTSPEGGDIPLTNITQIRTANFQPFNNVYDAKPTEIEFKKALDNLLREGKGPERTWKEKVGKRLYLYFAGHGFTAGSSLTDPALFSAIAQNGDTAHIAGYQYAAKIASAGFFDEIMLFMDCCQDVLKSSQVLVPTWSPPDRNLSHKVKLLQAIGAPRGQKAFERDLDNNGVTHGLFTIVLLEALRTAIPDSQGWVNGYDLKKQFSQIWGKRFRDETHYDPPIRLPDGEDIRILQRPSPTLSLGVPAPIPASTTIRIDLSKVKLASVLKSIPKTSRMSRQGRDFNYVQEVFSGSGKQNLPTGMFTIETEGEQSDLVFEVLPSEGTQQVGRIEFHEVPPQSAVAPESQSFEVSVSGSDRAMQVKILDSEYNTVAKGDGAVVAELTPGVYKAELIAGGACSQEIFRVVDRPLMVLVSAPLFSAPAPVLGTSSSHEYHSHPANDLALGAPLHSFPKADAELMVFVRASEPEYGKLLVRPYPWDGLFISNFASEGNSWRISLEVVEKERFFGATKLAVPAGSYSLCSEVRGESDGDELCLALRTIPGWRTEVYIDSSIETSDKTEIAGILARPDFSKVTVQLVRIGEPAMVSDELGTHTELLRARLAAGGRAIVPLDEDVKRSPMLGIYAAYATFQRDPDDKDTIKRCLRALPAEVRTLTDVQLLDAWLSPDVTTSPLKSLDIPLLTLAWDLSRRLPQENQLAPDLRGILGQWRIGGSLWTSWRRPTQANTASVAESLWPFQEGASYRTVLATARRLSTNGDQPLLLDPPLDMEDWRAHQELLRALIPGGSPFQQALRRRLLNAISMQEDVVEEQIFQLGAQYDLDRRWTVLEYRIFTNKVH